MDGVAHLLKFLRQHKLLNNDFNIDLEQLHKASEGPIRALAKKGLIKEGDVQTYIAEKLGIPTLDLFSPEIRMRVLGVDEISDKQAELLNTDLAVFIRAASGEIFLAMANPFNMECRQRLSFLSKFDFQCAVADSSAIIEILTELFPKNDHLFDLLPDLESESYVEILQGADEQDLDDSDVDLPPVVKLCNKILSDAFRAAASDVHIEPGQDNVEVRFRIDGSMHAILEVPKRLQSHLVSRFKVLAGMNIAERRKAQDGRMRVRVEGSALDIRASVVPTTYGEKIVLRLLSSDMRKLSMLTLGMPATMQAIVEEDLMRHSGLFLVTGPTGSGKTTTLYACLRQLRDGTSNIETVEDPVEYRIPGIHQIQVQENAGLTFASALRSILRQDPDVIMVGEIRDQETARIAAQAAQTGHLVLSTLHTNDASSAISRLLHLGVESYTLASSLVGVLAQRLVRKLCPHCTQFATPNDMEKEFLASCAVSIENLQIGKSCGCPQCRNSGYAGRAGLFSYLSSTPAFLDAISNGATTRQLEAIARANGFRSLADEAEQLLHDRVCSLDDLKPFLLERKNDAQHSSAQELRIQTAFDLKKVSPENALPGSLPKTKVVLIEDDENVRSIFQMLLEREMFEVIEAGNGQEGMKQIYEHSPALVVCDLMMPVMDGRALLRKMQDNPNTKNIPVLMLTAIDSEENEIDLLSSGATDFVSKAASSEVFLTRVRKAIRHHFMTS